MPHLKMLRHKLKILLDLSFVVSSLQIMRTALCDREMTGDKSFVKSLLNKSITLFQRGRYRSAGTWQEL